jgi:hypothetical protein
MQRWTKYLVDNWVSFHYATFMTDDDRKWFLEVIDSKFDYLDKKFDKKFDYLDKKFDRRFDYLDDKIGRSKIELSGEISDLRYLVHTALTKLDPLMGELQTVRQEQAILSQHDQDQMIEIEAIKATPTVAHELKKK